MTRIEFPSVDEQLQTLTRGVVEIKVLEDLRKKLERSRSCLLYTSDAADE